MEDHTVDKKACSNQQDSEVRKGPWTMEEDLILINYIATHGEGVWNNLARSAGLKRTGKSCRLRWLNYLRPDIRRGNITPEEQLLIMDLQARWGNRWSKIARQLPGRTDNEIKNFWRTRIQKKVKHADQDYDYDQGTNYQNSHYQNSDCDLQQKTKPTDQEGSSSHGVDEGMVPCSPMYIDDNHPDAFAADPSPAESNDGLWGVDDLWSIQLFNND